MARKLQKLINYHSSGTTKLTNEYSSVDFGELVVMHNSELPLLGIKTNDGEGAANGFAWFIDSASVVSAINSVGGDTLDLRRDLTELSGVTSALSENLTNNYATSSNTVTAIKNAIEGLDVEAITGTTSDTITSISETDGKISASYSPIFIKQNQVSGLTELASEVSTNSTNITTLSGHVFDTIADYATKTEVSAHVKTEIEKLDVTVTGTGAGKTLATLTETDGKIAATFQDIEVGIAQVTGLSGNLFTIEQNIQTNATNIGTVSGNVNTLSGSVVAMSAAVATTLGTVYHVKGSVANLTALNAVTGQSIGDVYNVVASSGTYGEESYVPAGTNYVWVKYEGEQGDGHWDALGGTVDLSGYATSANTYNAITGVQQTINTHIQGDFANVSGLVNSLSATVSNNYATKSDVSGHVATELAELSHTGTGSASKTLTAITQSNGKITTGFADIAITQSQVSGLTQLAAEVGTHSTNITSLSSATQTIEGKANESISAVTTGTVSSADNGSDLANATASGVKIKNDNENRGVTFDFSELIIDCGDF